MAASGWQSGAEPKKKQTQAKMMIILVINVKLLVSSVSIVQCSIFNILVSCNNPCNKYDEKMIVMLEMLMMKSHLLRFCRYIDQAWRSSLVPRNGGGASRSEDTENLLVMMMFIMAMVIIMRT